MKNKIVAVTAMLICFTLFAQNDRSDYLNLYNEVSQASTNNELTAYFNAQLPKQLIKNANIPKNQMSVKIIFEFDENQNLKNIRTNSKNKELSSALISAFKKYPISKLNIDTPSTKSLYLIDIISIENGEKMVKCSSNVVIENIPTLLGCENAINITEIRKCNAELLKDYVEKGINPELKEQYFKNDVIKFKSNFTFDTSGNLINLNITSTVTDLENEAKQILDSQTISLAEPFMVNNQPVQSNFNVSFSIKPFKSTNKSIPYYEFPLSTSNKIANYLKKTIPQELLQLENLNDKKSHASFSFTLNKANKIDSSNSTIKNEQLKDAVEKAFNNFPFKDFNIENNPEYLYGLNIISLINGENIIECNNELVTKTFPVLEECSDNTSYNDLKKCFSTELSTFIANNFNTQVASKTGYNNTTTRVYAMFEISLDGTIENIAVKAPNFPIEIETIKVLNQFPLAILKPGTENGEAVSFPYSLPLIINNHK